MNILVYIPSLDQSWGGVRQYTTGLLRILSQDTVNHYFIYHNVADPEVLAIIAASKQFQQVKDADIPTNWLQHKVARGKQISNFIARRASLKLEFEVNSTLDKLLDKYAIDIIHCPYQFTPTTRKAKTIVTLHDVQELHFPGFFTAEERAWRAVHFLQYLRDANQVVVSYEHVKADLIEYFAVPADRIQVVLLNMDKLWFENLLDEPPVAIDGLKLPERFIFYPANTWKHKNHLRLLQAIALLRNEQQCNVNLVCTGHLNKHYEAEIAPLLKAAGLEEQVRFIGIVDEPTLFSLYKHCVGVVVPTVYEAGSFPLVESMLLEVPVICSNVTSLPETIGEENFIFNPLSVESIAEKINLLWTSAEFRNQSVLNARAMSGRLKHTNACEKFLALYNSLGNNKANGNSSGE